MNEQIKPLTEEEKKAKLEELRQKMAEKRSKKTEVEIEEQKANEALRRKAGKVLISSTLVPRSNAPSLFRTRGKSART
jgi:hypothetical protein